MTNLSRRSHEYSASLKRDPEHKDHQKEEISIEVDSLRKSLSYALSNHQNSFKSFLMTTKESIVAARTRFATAVKERKGKCLKEYCELLNREEKLLLDKFEGQVWVVGGCKGGFGSRISRVIE